MCRRFNRCPTGTPFSNLRGQIKNIDAAITDSALKTCPESASRRTTIGGDPGKNPGLFKVPLDGGEATLLVPGEATNPGRSPDGRFVVYAGGEVGTRFQLKAATADGESFPIPKITLSRGSSRFAFLPNQPVLIVLEGEFWHKNFWAINLTTGKRWQLTNFPREYLIGDFDISPDGQAIIFDRVKERSDVMLIERRP